MIKKIATCVAVMLCAVMLFSGCKTSEIVGNPNNIKLDTKNPTAVTIWHYYNGAQLEAFNRLIDEFNETRGKELGIFVEGFSQGNVSDLENSVLDAVNHKVGAGEIPSIFAAYADTAYAVDKLGYAVDIKPYLTDDEINNFIDSYILEGEFSSDDSLKIFPVAKSTEIFMLNKTDWDSFSAATGADINDLSTIEGVTRTAEAYYNWTDSLTAERNDGKAFFGRDAMANYFLIGARQLGVEIFSKNNGTTALNYEKDVIRKLWDNYYIPFVKGHFAASGRFRSDDIKTGNIIAFIGSSSGATFFPDEVILNDDESYEIEMLVRDCPQFAGGGHYAVQQGAGMVVTNTDDKQIYASVEFLKWFTQDERNIAFSVASGYLPVTKSANDIDKIYNYVSDKNEETYAILSVAMNAVNNNELYTTKAFEEGTDARDVLEYSMSDKAAADRKVVVENLRTGATLDEATAQFTSDNCFESWYQETKAMLEKLVK